MAAPQKHNVMGPGYLSSQMVGLALRMDDVPSSINSLSDNNNNISSSYTHTNTTINQNSTLSHQMSSIQTNSIRNN